MVFRSIVHRAHWLEIRNRSPGWAGLPNRLGTDPYKAVSRVRTLRPVGQKWVLLDPRLKLPPHGRSCRHPITATEFSDCQGIAPASNNKEAIQGIVNRSNRVAEGIWRYIGEWGGGNSMELAVLTIVVLVLASQIPGDFHVVFFR
jgi:hypothetical protein